MTITAPTGTTASVDITREELQLAARNHGMPLEAMQHDVTPVGLHYLLIHYDIPMLDAQMWRLAIDGAVRSPGRLTLDDVRARPAVTRPVTMECAGNGRSSLSPRALSQPWLVEAVGTGEWTGTPLWPLLADAGLGDDVVDIVFTGADRGVEGGQEQRYQRSLSPAQARDEDALLVYALNGAPLPPQHGFPLRLLVPGWYGMTSVKWLTRITASTAPFAGYQQAHAYRFRDAPGDEGVPVTRMHVRSLMVPPGVPDFYTRRRHLRAGRVTLAGRAWSGAGHVVSVEVSTDGGATWRAARLDPPAVAYAWQHWSVGWDADEGEHELLCRATDSAGATQPLEPAWNLGGYAANAAHRVPVIVSGHTDDH